MRNWCSLAVGCKPSGNSGAEPPERMEGGHKRGVRGKKEANEGRKQKQCNFINSDMLPIIQSGQRSPLTINESELWIQRPGVKMSHFQQRALSCRSVVVMAMQRHYYNGTKRAIMANKVQVIPNDMVTIGKILQVAEHWLSSRRSRPV